MPCYKRVFFSDSEFGSHFISLKKVFEIYGADSSVVEYIYREKNVENEDKPLITL